MEISIYNSFPIINLLTLDSSLDSSLDSPLSEPESKLFQTMKEKKLKLFVDSNMNETFDVPLKFEKNQSGILIYECTECSKKFNRKRNLVDHFRGHHSVTKPHLCVFPGCNKSFLRPAHLLIHERVHTGEKPFKCDFPGCTKRWNQKSALKQHLRKHTGEKPYPCSFCSKKFSTSSSCKRHQISHQQEIIINTSNAKNPLFIKNEDKSCSLQYNSITGSSNGKMSLNYLIN